MEVPTARGNIKNGVHNLAHIRRPRTAALLGQWQEGLNIRPFPVRHIAWIYRPRPLIPNTSDIIPGHVVLQLLDKDG